MESRFSDTEILISGVNHHTADISLREKFSVSDFTAMLQEVQEHTGAHEVVVLSTCNRVEILTTNNVPPKQFRETVSEIFERSSGLSANRIEPILYHLNGREAVQHLFRVAAGLDSLVVGEPQILGQLKDAYHRSRQCGTAGTFVHRLFDRSFRVAKVVRARTRIGHEAVSIAFAARKLAEQIFGELRNARVMLIGTGETGTLALKHFLSAGAKQALLVNRTLKRAFERASELGGVPLSFENLPEFLPEADIVLGASTLTTGDAHLVTEEMARESLKLRGGTPQFFIDLGVPRNFSPTIESISDAFVYNVDDLEMIVRRNVDSRLLEVKRAELIVEEEVEKFFSWLRRQDVEPTIRNLIQRSSFQSEAEIRKTLNRIRREHGASAVTPELEETLRSLCDGVVKKILHHPLNYLKQVSGHDEFGRRIFEDMFFGPNDNEPESSAESSEDKTSYEESSSELEVVKLTGSRSS